MPIVLLITFIVLFIGVAAFTEVLFAKKKQINSLAKGIFMSSLLSFSLAPVWFIGDNLGFGIDGNSTNPFRAFCGNIIVGIVLFLVYYILRNSSGRREQRSKESSTK